MDSEMMVCLFAYVIKGPLDKGASRSESAEMLEGRGKGQRRKKLPPAKNFLVLKSP